MIGNDLFDAPDFRTPEVAAIGQPYGIQPDLCDAVLAFHVHMSRLAAIARVEENTIGPRPQNGRQSVDFLTHGNRAGVGDATSEPGQCLVLICRERR